MQKDNYIRAASPAEIQRQVKTFNRLKHSHAQFFDFLRRVIRPSKKIRVLEMGCGCGMLADMARTELSAKAAGWDSNPEYIRFASSAFRQTSFDARSFMCPPCTGDKFDIVLFREAIMECREPAAILKWSKKFIKPGGWAAALEPDYGATIIYPEVPGWCEFLYRYAAICAKDGDEDFFAGRKLLDSFSRAGFKGLAVQPITEVRSALCARELKEFIGAEIMSISADIPFLSGKTGFSRAELKKMLKGLKAVIASPGAYVQTTMIAVCGRK